MLYKTPNNSYYKNIYTMSKKNNNQRGEINSLVIVIVVLIILVLGLGGFGVWSYMNYTDQKNHVDIKIAAAVADAKKVQSDSDATNFAEQAKLPTKTFVGPDDLGHPQFSYPKTWSAYVGNNNSDGTGNFEAYFHPDFVPPLTSGTAFALRFSISNTAYDQSLLVYDDAIKQGVLKSSPITVDSVTGIRLDGSFGPNIKGSMVIVKIRDKTLRVFTESPDFRPDFDNYILKSLRFNK